MHPQFTLLGVTFYWYGLIVGLALALALWLIEWRARAYDRARGCEWVRGCEEVRGLAQNGQLDRAQRLVALDRVGRADAIKQAGRPQRSESADQSGRVRSKQERLVTGGEPSLQHFFQHWSLVLVAGGLIGARAWHIVTDWQTYWGQWSALLFVNQGGLSIIGAIIGGGVSLLLLRTVVPATRRYGLLLILDTIVFGLPFGQMLGRLGNWINQELYGPPTTLPWAIRIDPAHRLVGYAQYATYHPLFFYEALALALIGGGIWWLDRRTGGRNLGSGIWALAYLSSYALVRFWLDFLRLDRPAWLWGLGSNQWVLLATIGGCLVLWLSLLRRRWRY